MPKVKHYAWHMLGIWLAYAWNMFGISLAYAWKVLGISLAYARNMLGICAWNMLGLSLAYASYSMHAQSGTAQQHEKPKKMVKVPNECLTWSITLGICLEYVWNKLGICLGSTWNKLGIGLQYAWSKLSMHLESVWNKLGMCLAYASYSQHTQSGTALQHEKPKKMIP